MSPEGAAGLLTVDELRVTFRTEDGPLRAVDGVSFAVAPGETLAVVGESGSGKSVTALAVMGLLPARGVRREGRVTFQGRDLTAVDGRTLREVRGNRIAMVFQDPMTSLNPVLTVGRQISEALLVHQRATKRQAPGRAAALLALVGIADPRRRLREYPHQFSGDMRQRVMIAMAMACEPDLLIADEPTTALDVTVQAQVLDVLDRAKAETDAALLLITHDLGIVAGRAGRVIVMYAGRIVEAASTDDLFYHPRMPYTLGLLGSTTRIDTGRSDELEPIPGQPPSLVHLPPGCPFHPRCRFAKPVCVEERPELRRVGEAHVAACHFAEQMVDAEPRPAGVGG